MQQPIMLMLHNVPSSPAARRSFAADQAAADVSPELSCSQQLNKEPSRGRPELHRTAIPGLGDNRRCSAKEALLKRTASCTKFEISCSRMPGP